MEGWGVLNVIISSYKKLAATAPPEIYSIIVLEHNTY